MQAGFSRALGDAHQHDVHDAHAAHQRAGGGYRAQRVGQHAHGAAQRFGQLVGVEVI